MYNLATACLLASVLGLKRGGIIVNGHTLTRSQTRLQLRVLGRWFDFIGLDELPRRLHGPCRRPFCLLTFDDGKLNHYTEIAPELESRGVPAVFYVATEAISSRTWLWFDRREALLEKLGRCPPGLELEALKRLPFDLLNERLDRACAQFNLPPDAGDDRYSPMSWSQARNLAARGFTIGAHGCTHAILTQEPPVRAQAEIEQSMARVSLELGCRCATFAFPNGNYSPNLARQALRCGATTVMTTEPMWVDHRSTLWRLPRVQLFGQSTRSRIELKLALAAIRGVLTNPDGSGRTYRQNEKRWRALQPTTAAL